MLCKVPRPSGSGSTQRLFSPLTSLVGFVMSGSLILWRLFKFVSLLSLGLCLVSIALSILSRYGRLAVQWHSPPNQTVMVTDETGLILGHGLENQPLSSIGY